MKHLTATEIAEFRRGTLPAGQLLEADGHLQQCSQCRRNLLDLCPNADSAALWERTGEDHLNYEQLEAYADGHLSQAQHTTVMAHLALCSQCQGEADDLCAFRKQLRPPARHATRWLALAASAAAALVVVAGVWWWQRAGQIPSRYAPLVATALQTGSVEIAPRVGEWRTQAGVLRGDTHTGGFRLESPLATSVVDGSPTFRWQSAALDAASSTSYEVRVFGSDLLPVIESGPLTRTEWVPPKPLPRGQLYLWQVTALVNGKTIHAPGAAAPEAKFFVLEQSAVDELENARHSGNALLLGLLYARAGVLDLAEDELAAYAEEHPTPQMRALLARFRSQIGRP